MPVRPPAPVRVPFRAVLLLWSIPAWITTLQYFLLARGTSRAVPLFHAFLGEGCPWYVWALLTPPIVYLAQRRPLDRRWTVRLLLPHLVANLAAGALYAGADAFLARFIRADIALTGALFKSWFFSTLPITTVTYIGVVGLCYAWINTRRLWAQERDSERLAAQLGQAELAALRMQLQPHFLFNSLNSIMALVRDRETERSIEALAFLGDVLRTTLRPDHDHEVSLGEELEFMRRYLAIERLRFADRLRVRYDVPDTLNGATVPLFLLQPLVENALRHGVLPERQGGEVTILARTQGEAMIVTVTDTGRGLPPAFDIAATGGIGLTNTRTRLAHLYGDAARLSIRNRADGHGVEVCVEMPLRYRSPRSAA